MTNELALVGDIDKEAILKALNLNPRDPKTQALLLVCDRYGLDPLLKHMVLISGNAYITRDGYLAIAHRSGKFDGMEVLESGADQTHWVAKVAVYRKDMSHPFTYIGRYPKSGTQKNYGPEMAVKCAEVMGLRRAFNVTGVGAADEAWDSEVVQVDVGTGEIVDTSAEPKSTIEKSRAVKKDDPVGPVVFDELKARKQALDPDYAEQLQKDLSEAGLLAFSANSNKEQAATVAGLLDVIEARQKPVWLARQKRVFAALAKFDPNMAKNDDLRHQFISDATGGATESAGRLTEAQADAIVGAAIGDGSALDEQAAS